MPIANYRPPLPTLLCAALGVALLAGCATEEPSLPEATGPTDWPSYLGGDDSAQYSALTQIDPSNVARLEVAWIYHAGGIEEGRNTVIQCNPLVREGVLYGLNPQLRLFALDGATGEELWTFDPLEGRRELAGIGQSRGVNYWQNADARDRRILYGAGDRIYAVDAQTGQPVRGFGDDGSVSLYIGMPEDTHDLYLAARTPGVVFENLLVFGSVTSESLPAAPGDVRAIDIETGELMWTFHTIPEAGEPGSETWPVDARRHLGAANNWAGMSLDVERELLYVPLGSAAYDFYGGNRPGENLYANSLVALEARTGQLRWHYQTVHHDVWDRDLPAPPNLLTIVHEGGLRDVVAQITKSGYVFVFDRDTGEPIWPIEEQAFPASDLPAEQTWPTQPIPTRPPQFSRGTLDPVADASNISPEYEALATERFQRLRIGPYEPPSLEGTVIFPGFDGGGEWGGAAVDPESAILYVNASEVPWLLRMVEIETGGFATTADLGRMIYARGCLLCHGTDRQGDALGEFPSLAGIEERMTEAQIRDLIRSGRNRMPGSDFLDADQLDGLIDFLLDRASPLDPEARTSSAYRPTEHQPFVMTGYARILDPDGNPLIKPPWGRLNAIDLNRGEILWQVPLGELPELTAQGIPPTGTENYGGPIVTRSGLIFIGATKDRMFRAFDAANGEILWQFELPTAAYATPSTYQVNGRQYVVIAAGGGRLGPPSGDAYVALALPE